MKDVLEAHKKWLNSDGKEGQRADLRRADLRRANLRRANLRRANLRRANLYNANLYNADLRRANLKRADLLAANLYGANLSSANLYGANLSSANLYGADLSSANLYGANLYGANGIVSFGPVGDEGRIGYAVAHDDEPRVKLGCFWGTQTEAVTAIREKYGIDSTYEALVVAACKVLTDA
jgi:hypothetical protein